MLMMVVLSACFADYWAYSVEFHKNPTVYVDILQGTATAPMQYRVGIVKAAYFLTRHSPLALRHAMTAIDTVMAFVTVFTLFFLLLRTAWYRTASVAVRWFATAGFLVLVEFYLAWLTWYQRPETMANAAFVALTVLLMTVRPPLPGAAAQWLSAVTMLVLAALQGFIRADVAFALHAGVLLVCLTGVGKGMALSRPLQMATSLGSVLVAGGEQYYLMHVVYPHANYGSTPPFQLILNIKNYSGWLPFLIFVFPFAWTVVRSLGASERRRDVDTCLLCGSAVFFAMWVTVGRIEEVRIFLPFALATTPTTIGWAVGRYLTWDGQERGEGQQHLVAR